MFSILQHLNSIAFMQLQPQLLLSCWSVFSFLYIVIGFSGQQLTFMLNPIHLIFYNSLFNNICLQSLHIMCSLNHYHRCCLLAKTGKRLNVFVLLKIFNSWHNYSSIGLVDWIFIFCAIKTDRQQNLIVFCNWCLLTIHKTMIILMSKWIKLSPRHPF